jgi:hypothetical protein
MVRQGSAWRCAAVARQGRAWPAEAWHGEASQCPARHGMVRLGQALHGKFGRVLATLCMARQGGGWRRTWQGMTRCGKAGRFMAGPGGARPGTARQGLDRRLSILTWRGAVWLIKAALVLAVPGVTGPGCTRHGASRSGWTRQGWSWVDNKEQRRAWQCYARRRMAPRHGATQVTASLGQAPLARARQGLTGRGSAWQA